MMTLLFLFRVNDDGSQTVVVRQTSADIVDHEGFIQFRDEVTKDLPCGRWQVDSVTEKSVRSQFPDNSSYADSQWAKWQALREGDTVVEQLAGAYESGHVAVLACATTTTAPAQTTTTTALVMGTSTSLVPLPTVTSTTVAATSTSLPTRTLATTGTDSMTLVVLALVLMVMGGLTQVRGKKA